MGIQKSRATANRLDTITARTVGAPACAYIRSRIPRNAGEDARAIHVGTGIAPRTVSEGQVSPLFVKSPGNVRTRTDGNGGVVTTAMMLCPR